MRFPLIACICSIALVSCKYNGYTCAMNDARIDDTLSDVLAKCDEPNSILGAENYLGSYVDIMYFKYWGNAKITLRFAGGKLVGKYYEKSYEDKK